MDVVWAVKWPAVAAKGLQPVRPAVVLNFGSESGQMCVCVCVCVCHFQVLQIVCYLVSLFWFTQSRKGSVTIPAKKALEIVPADAA